MDGLESVRVKKPNERQWGPDGGWCTPGFLTALSRVLDGVTPMSSLGVRGCIRERERERGGSGPQEGNFGCCLPLFSSSFRG